MFFISWGSRGDVAEVGSAGVWHCSYCEHDAPFTKMVSYTVRHVYWVFRWTTDRTPFMICGNCGGTHAGQDEDFDSKETRSAIPMFDRRGWLFGAGGIGALVASVSLAAAADVANEKVYVADPHVGDVYEVDLAQIFAKPEAPHMYAAMRVTKVDAAGVEVEMGMRYYNKWRGVDDDISKGLTLLPSYYGPDRQTFAKASIERMYADGVMHDVRR